MNYDELEPGEELDALVEEIVFGRKWVRRDWVMINGRRFETETWMLDGYTPENPRGGSYAGQRPPQRSAKIDLAWEVVERMHNDGFHLVLFYNDFTHKWNAVFPLVIKRINNVERTIAPHAICIAALRAKET